MTTIADVKKNKKWDLFTKIVLLIVTPLLIAQLFLPEDSYYRKLTDQALPWVVSLLLMGIGLWSLFSFLTLRKVHGHPLLLLGYPSGRYVYLIMWSIGIVFFLGRIIGGNYSNMGDVIFFVGIITYGSTCIILSLPRIQVFEDGIWDHLSFYRWNQMESYHWQDERRLVIQFKWKTYFLATKFFSRTEITVPPEKKEPLEAILSQHDVPRVSAARELKTGS